MIELVYEVRKIEEGKFEPFALTLKLNNEISYVCMVYENVFKFIFSTEDIYLVTTNVGTFFANEITTVCLDRDCNIIYKRTTKDGEV